MKQDEMPAEYGGLAVRLAAMASLIADQESYLKKLRLRQARMEKELMILWRRS